ncbi:Uma2 family endonuclease [Kibdelosporangium phytohabitans]|nr:Uma2 family endonuclease [Kibdelosporangium phytohabitans]
MMTWPNHLLSLADWDALPEDNTHRYELAEGILQVSPRPVPNHQWAVMQLAFQVGPQLQADLGVLSDVEVVIVGGSPATVRAPDLVVVRTAAAKASPARFAPDDVLLAVEVISPGSRRTDRVTKFNEYAEAGIPDYWIIDLSAPVSVTAFQLIDGNYELNAGTDDVLSVTTPVPLTVKVRDLLP